MVLDIRLSYYHTSQAIVTPHLPSEQPAMTWFLAVSLDKLKATTTLWRSSGRSTASMKASTAPSGLRCLKLGGFGASRPEPAAVALEGFYFHDSIAGSFEQF